MQKVILSPSALFQVPQWNSYKHWGKTFATMGWMQFWLINYCSDFSSVFAPTKISRARFYFNCLMAIINRCANLGVVGIVTSRFSFSHFADAASTHNFPMLSLPGQRGTTTDLASKLPSRRLRCHWGRSSSPRREGITNCLVHCRTYSYVGNRLQEPHNVR